MGPETRWASLLDAVCRGDEEALLTVLERMAPAMRGQVRSVPAAWQEDTLSDIMLAVLVALHGKCTRPSIQAPSPDSGDNKRG
jgi:hypothetical protein